MEDFLLSHQILKTDNYLFFVATYGTTPGQSGYFACEALKKTRGISFDAYFSVKMPDTWTPLFDLSDSEKVARINEQVEPQIDKLIAQIMLHKSPAHMDKATPVFTRFVYRPYYDYMRQTKKFSVDETCVHCGQCAKKCPVQAIELKDGKPTWTKDKCAMCLGCLHRCPKFAIQYGNNTKKHGQYMNPHTTV